MHPNVVWQRWPAYRKRVYITAVVLVASLAGLSVFWQALYPPDRALPSLHIGGLDVGHRDKQAIVDVLTDYAQNGIVTLNSPSRTWQAKWQSAGISVDPEASADAAIAYSAWERAIPFSSLIKEVRSSQLPLVAIVDDDRLTAFAKQVVAEDKLAAHDATITVKDGVVAIDKAKNGYEFTVESVKQQLQSAVVGANTKITLIPQTHAARPESELASVKAAAESWIAKRPTMLIAGKTITLEPATVGKWLVFPQDEKTKAFSVKINREAVAEYLTTLDKDFGREAGTSTVTMLDGQEIVRTPAAPGQTLATDANITALETAVNAANSGKATLALGVAPPKLNYVRTYSQSDEGLLAIVNEWRRTNTGDYSVIIRELGGKNRYAEVTPDKPYVTASTFKIFVYYAIQLKIQAGQINYQTKTDMGWTVEDCLQEMIVRSTNPCAVALLNLTGWQWAEDRVHDAGFSGTFINNYSGGDKHSTIRDEVNYMMRLYYGTLMGDEGTNRLLGYLKRQIWRAGIPSGVPKGTPVADKVGQYDGWMHDVGIVYGPKSTYIVGIFSHYGNEPAFADLSRRMYDFFQN